MTRVRMRKIETSGYLYRYRPRKPKTKPTRKASHEDAFYFNQYDASQRPREEYSREADIEQESESSGVDLEIDG
ncbi:9569_t:CDS:2, partial [Paraglomus occultum]